MRRVLLRAVSFSVLLGCGCGGGDPPTGVIDARLQPDAPDIPRQLTIVMSLLPHSPRPLPMELQRVPLAVVSQPQHGQVELAGGTIRYAIDPPFPSGLVERIRATAIDNPQFTIDFVLVVNGAVFTGAVNGDAGLDGNWDQADGVPIPPTWVFVREAPRATVPIGAARAAPVLVDDGATVILRDLALTGAGFTNRGTLEPPIGTTRSMVALTDGTAAGRVPHLEAHATVTLAADVDSERIVVNPGSTLVVGGGHTLATGIGESFVEPGGTLDVNGGTFTNGRALTVDGTLRALGANTAVELLHLDGAGTLRLDRGTLRLASANLAAATLVVADGHRTIVDGGAGSGALVLAPGQAFATVDLLGTLDLPGAPLRARGPVTLAAAIGGALVADTTVTVTALSRLDRLTAATLAVDHTLHVAEAATVTGTTTIAAAGQLSLDAGSTNTFRDLTVAGRLVVRGNTTITGTLDLAAGADLDHEGGTLTITSCRSGGVPDAPPCP